MNFIKFLCEYIADTKNLALVLSDKSLSLGEKVLFLIRHPYFWCLMVFLVLMVGVVCVLLLIMIMIRQEALVKEVSRKEWGAMNPKFEPKQLSLPVNRIVLTHTNDFLESCFTEVNDQKIMKSFKIQCQFI